MKHAHPRTTTNYGCCQHTCFCTQGSALHPCPPARPASRSYSSRSHRHHSQLQTQPLPHPQPRHATAAHRLRSFTHQHCTRTRVRNSLERTPTSAPPPVFLQASRARPTGTFPSLERPPSPSTSTRSTKQSSPGGASPWMHQTPTGLNSYTQQSSAAPAPAPAPQTAQRPLRQQQQQRRWRGGRCIRCGSEASSISWPIW